MPPQLHFSHELLEASVQGERLGQERQKQQVTSSSLCSQPTAGCLGMGRGQVLKERPCLMAPLSLAKPGTQCSSSLQLLAGVGEKWLWGSPMPRSAKNGSSGECILLSCTCSLSGCLVSTTGLQAPGTPHPHILLWSDGW